MYMYRTASQILCEDHTSQLGKLLQKYLPERQSVLIIRYGIEFVLHDHDQLAWEKSLLSYNTFMYLNCVNSFMGFFNAGTS